MFGRFKSPPKLPPNGRGAAGCEVAGLHAGGQGGVSPPCYTMVKAYTHVGVITMGVRKIKKGCHAEALEACALGIADCALAVMHGVKAFARMVPFDKLRAGFASP